jgi:opacity protein-like surface antigen/outer membrane protease
MQKKHLLAGVAFTALLAGSATAADMRPIKAPPLPAPFTWTGGYVGLTAGGAWGAYDTTTSTALSPGGYFPNAATVAAVNAAGPQSIKPGGFATGIEAGYNWQNGALLVGVEADLQALHLSGAANGGAALYPAGFHHQFVVSSYADSTWLFTARARVGLVANNWLFFATGGLAVTQLTSDLLFTDSGGALEEGQIDTVKTGYAVGGGVEAPLTDRLSLKAEYLYVKFSDTTVSGSLPPPPSQAFTHSAGLAANIVRVGLNYRFVGVDPWRGGAVIPVKAPLLKAPPLVGSDWEVETGARLWLSTGTIGAPQPLLNSPDTLASRLTYKDLDAISGETFARVDHASGWFVKGFLGAGRITDGNMYDEDFPAFFAYSNTVQSNNSGSIGYANIDLGYTFLKAPGAKVGAFVGYNYYRQHVNTYGCTQLAGDAVCIPAGLVPANFIGIAEDDRFSSLRLGLSAQFMLTDRLKLTTDVAYVPVVDFSGQDDHNARELLLPEASSQGNGVMLEAILGYAVTEAWNVGVGGRYWAWNMRTGTETFNFLGSSDPPLIEPARFYTERYGVFVETSYKWAGTTPPPAAGAPIPTKGPAVAAAAMNWTGIYIGAHLGGGWSNDRWSDPFGSTPGAFGFFNVAGFGDTTHATGPLGGGQIGYNVQSGQWVLGVEADASVADLRGENTCFSGLVGLNCQRIVDALGTVAGRLGYAWDRSLAYVKGGGAWINSTYNINGNTSVLTLGTGSTGITAWGRTVGGGIEYALTNNWTARIEYDHIEVPSTVVAFPTVALVNAQTISVRQWIDTVKLGVSYKLDWNPLAGSF